MVRYAELLREGESTFEARQELLEATRRDVIARIAELHDTLAVLDHKIEFYAGARLAPERHKRLMNHCRHDRHGGAGYGRAAGRRPGPRLHGHEPAPATPTNAPPATPSTPPWRRASRSSTPPTPTGAGANEEFLAPFVRAHRDESPSPPSSPSSAPTTPTTEGISNDPAYIRTAVEASLRRLGTDVIDLYYMHRRDPAVRFAESIGALAELVQQGKVKQLGLSEVTGPELREAYAVHPIAALQSEWSLFTRDVEKSAVGRGGRPRRHARPVLPARPGLPHRSLHRRGRSS
ncbi:hypothetical protein SVIOM74S_00905 [Streptomyces violarus]